MSSPTELERELPGVARADYGEEYSRHLFEQYRLYVELADKISERRQSANTYLLSVNTVLVAILGLAMDLPVRPWVPLFPVAGGLAGILLSYTWFRLINSYRQLNAGKFTIVHEMERRLPLKPYDAEWTVLGRGKNLALYRPFTSVETWVPVLFSALYLFLVGAALLWWVA